MFSLYKENVVTKDGKTVSLAIQTTKIPDLVLINNIKICVQKNFDTSIAVSTLDANYKTVSLSDSNGKHHNFGACFILTWNDDYSKVLNADLLSFVELL